MKHLPLILAILLTGILPIGQPLHATTLEEPISIPDISHDAWYYSDVVRFVSFEYLPNNVAFRPSSPATRADFIQLIVKLNGGVLSPPPNVPSFDDVSRTSSSYDDFEEAAREEWIRGEGDCYGTHPCYARPRDPITRAEAAALLMRAFALFPGEAPIFEDAPRDTWYGRAIHAAAHSCVLRGDAGTKRVRPADNMNRAEMITMISRIDKSLSFPDCR